MVWQHDYLGAGTDWDIKGQFLDVFGGKIGSVLAIAQTVDNETRPALAANGGLEEYLTVWQRETTWRKSIYGRLLYTDLTSKNPFEIAPPAGGDNENPAIGSQSSGYFITYTWDSFTPTTYGDVYGKMYVKPTPAPPVPPRRTIS